MFYRPGMRLTSFAELGLPYVTLTEASNKGDPKLLQSSDDPTMCLSEERFTADYDWAMLADIDEFLWFSGDTALNLFGAAAK
jgi:hypothetical protein